MKQALRFFMKPYRWAIGYGLTLAILFALALLDDFLIERIYSTAPPGEDLVEIENAQMEPVITSNSYKDGMIEIEIKTVRVHETTAFLADIKLKDAELLKTAFAQNSYGRNLVEPASEMAVLHNTILTINGDFYGYAEKGYVLRNGTLYREKEGTRALMMFMDGNMKVIDEKDITEEDIEKAWQIWSFGPALIADGKVSVDQGSEVTGRSSSSNPRTAIGQIGPLHYLFAVSNGRMRDERGLSLEELAELMQEHGCQTAYNLDGGGSSVMVFNGEILNTPTSGGGRIGERPVSDIVYIGY